MSEEDRRDWVDLANMDKQRFEDQLKMSLQNGQEGQD